MYDMYPWNEPESGLSRPGEDAPGPRRPGAEAVQFALDRRDNGGDAVAVTGQPPTQPTAGRTRQ